MTRSALCTILLSLALLAQPWLAPADAGYSSGKSSVSHSSVSHSSSSHTSSASHSSSISHSSSGYSSGKGTSYSSGKSSSFASGKGTSYTTPSRPASSGTFGSSAATAQRQEEIRRGTGAGSISITPSRTSAAPRTVYRTPDPRQRQMSFLRSRLNAESFASRDLRAQSFYGPYIGGPAPTYAYHDGYSPWFWLWLLDRRPQVQAAWLYNHRSTMDQARYDSLANENATLRDRIAALESQGVPRDPTYVPDELPEADLMYSDSFAAAATQPSAEADIPVESSSPPPSAPMTSDDQTMVRPMPVAFSRHVQTGWPPLFSGFFYLLAIAGIVAAVGWAVRRRPSLTTSGWSGGQPPPLPRPAQSPPPMPASSPAIDNPLNLQIGQTFALALSDYAGWQFNLEQILEYAVPVGAATFRYTAYWAVARPPGSDRVPIQLRVERQPGGRLAILALRLHDQFDYSKEFYDIVATDGTGRFQITDDATGQVTAEYFRPEGVLSSYTATVSALNHPAEPTLPRTLQYWDYSRTLDTPQGQTAEYLIVELEESGRFRILLGPQIDASLVRA